ncbi:MAG: hypothetical protein KIT85_20115 [Pseudolabrys sp.]|nr:hypothetical protein [Pseudolabrys sp.]MCW5686706.1 hypothetical protein [Pseudolabrys sp.]
MLICNTLTTIHDNIFSRPRQIFGLQRRATTAARVTISLLKIFSENLPREVPERPDSIKTVRIGAK